MKRARLPRSTKPIKRSWVKRGTKKIPRENVEATRKRRLRNQKRMRSREYKAARAGAMERSGGRCEHIETIRFADGGTMEMRCPYVKDGLQFHEEHYARGRILTKDDGKMLCPLHHRLAERQKPHKQHRSGF